MQAGLDASRLGLARTGAIRPPSLPVGAHSCLPFPLPVFRHESWAGRSGIYRYMVLYFASVGRAVTCFSQT